MRIGSLFSGYGGLDMATEAVFGGTTAWVSDIDKGACMVLAHRYPGIPNLGNATAVDWASVEPVEILTGGTPCQDLSKAGKRAGLTKGTRSNLWVAMREAIAQLRPQIVVWENVRGATSAKAISSVEPCPGCVGDGTRKHLRALGRILGDLADLRYDAQWCCLRASDVGAPHQRERIFLVAENTAGLRGPQALQHHGGEAPQGSEGDEPGFSHQRDSDPAGAGPQRVMLLPTPVVNDMGAGKTVTAWEAWTDDMKAKHGNGNGHGNSLSIEVQRVAATQWGAYARAVTRWEQVTGQDSPNPTQPAGGSHQLAPAFVEWMMGLPPGWVTGVPGLTRSQALKLLGNGVVPQQAIAALQHLVTR